MDQELADLQQQWAVIKYQTPDHARQEQEISALADRAEQLSHDNPGNAEALIWQAIIISTQADIENNIGALGEAGHARDLLLQAEKINPRALGGLVYTSLGVLYYKVPGWPVSFGDKQTARQYLEKGLAINPDGLDANFFYGDFLYQDRDFSKAGTVLTHALAAPQESGGGVADGGRRQEIRALLAKIGAEE